MYTSLGRGISTHEILREELELLFFFFLTVLYLIVISVLHTFTPPRFLERDYYFENSPVIILSRKPCHPLSCSLIQQEPLQGVLPTHTHTHTHTHTLWFLGTLGTGRTEISNPLRLGNTQPPPGSLPCCSLVFCTSQQCSGTLVRWHMIIYIPVPIAGHCFI